MNKLLGLEHTPLPWTLHSTTYGSQYVVSMKHGNNGPIYVAGVESMASPDRHKYSAPREQAIGNAKLLVHAVNAYPVLVDAIRRAADMLPANAACGILRHALEWAGEK